MHKLAAVPLSEGFAVQKRIQMEASAHTGRGVSALRWRCPRCATGAGSDARRCTGPAARAQVEAQSVQVGIMGFLRSGLTARADTTARRRRVI